MTYWLSTVELSKGVFVKICMKHLKVIIILTIRNNNYMELLDLFRTSMILEKN